MTTENRHEDRTKNKRVSLLQFWNCASQKRRAKYAPTSEFNGTIITAVQLRLPISPEHPTQGLISEYKVSTSQKLLLAAPSNNISSSHQSLRPDLQFLIPTRS
jgi:hypothetical protein